MDERKTDIFNPNPLIQTVALANGQCCFVIDDVLAEPERWVKFADERQTDFRLPGGGGSAGYPGIQFALPQAAIQQLTEFFLLHMRARLDARRLVSAFWGMSMVTLQPASLQPSQCLCHTDFIPGQAQGNGMTASVLYLFKDGSIGGTSLYAPRQSREETAVIVRDSLAMDSRAFEAKYGIAPGYMNGPNAYFDLIGRIDAKWNRIVFYDGDIFHTGDIFAPEKLSADPRVGRLTMNGFITCTRRAK
ncbi:MAG: DUF6445 family protein [Pseudomonadota bacterium]